MAGLTRETYARPRNLSNDDDSAVLYAKSYLLIRIVVGLIGVLLPAIFIIGEAFFLRGGVHLRGSLSAYYHSSMRDMFVAGLSVVGILLATYMAGQRDTYDFWFSLVAGVAVLGVVAFPTTRPGLAGDAPRCGTDPMPNGCSPFQQQFGEELTGRIHAVCAAIFILSLAVIAFLFAYREKKWKGSAGVALVQRICGFVIILSAAGAAIGELLDLSLGELTPLYVGEVASVWAFGVSWLLAGRDIMRRLVPVPVPPDGSGQMEETAEPSQP